MKPVKEKFHSETQEGIEAVFARMLKVVGNPLFISYAQAFDVSENTIKTWRHRGAVSLQYLAGFAREHGESLDWLLYGDKPGAVQSDTHQVNEQASTYGLSKDEIEMLENYRRCTPSGRNVLLATSAEMALAAPPAHGYKPRQKFGIGAQPGKVLFQAGQNKPSLMSGKAAPRGKKTKKENE